MESWHNWLLSNWSRLLKWKGPGTWPHCSKIPGPPKIPENSLFISINYSKMYPALCTNIHHDVTDLINGMVKNAKTWISWERNIIFPRNKKILNLCIRWHIFWSYRFVQRQPLNVTKFLVWISALPSIWLIKIFSSTEVTFKCYKVSGVDIRLAKHLTDKNIFLVGFQNLATKSLNFTTETQRSD